MLKRIFDFEKRDWQHCWWLLKNMVRRFMLGDFAGANEVWMYLKLHLTHDYKKVL